jgi:hypothetical protein
VVHVSGSYHHHERLLPVRNDDSWDISPRCRIDLDEYGLRLFFQKNEVVFVFLGDTEAPRYLVTPLEYLSATERSLTTTSFGQPLASTR